MREQISKLIELQEIDGKVLSKAEKSKKANNGVKIRKKLASSLNPNLFSLYEKLYQARDGEALAKMEDGTCSACNVVLPTQEIGFISEQKSIVQCWNCSRILYD